MVAAAETDAPGRDVTSATSVVARLESQFAGVGVADPAVRLTVAAEELARLLPALGQLPNIIPRDTLAHRLFILSEAGMYPICSLPMIRLIAHFSTTQLSYYQLRVETVLLLTSRKPCEHTPQT
jgi:hypothetical protein